MWNGVRSTSPAETRAAGMQFVTQLPPGTVAALHGELGSGKTTFVRGMAAGLGLTDQVSSPTFELIHEYGSPVGLYHIDCFREQALERWQSLGLQEYFDGDARTVVEWAELILPLLPKDTIHLQFTHGSRDSERWIEVRP
ncbi:MAG: tRNA (adenosine(37)-N6)-threonylcarbamoyltransferase complex ATPase subunit type 1 TsaE [Candidatus Neomarinimicrobiota bacterium]